MFFSHVRKKVLLNILDYFLSDIHARRNAKFNDTCAVWVPAWKPKLLCPECGHVLSHSSRCIFPFDMGMGRTEEIWVL